MSNGARPISIPVAQGNWGSVECAVCLNGKSPAHDFLMADLEEVRLKGKSDLQSTAKAKFLALFDQMASNGRVSGDKLRSEMGGLCAFALEVRNLQIRFPCFPDGRRWILTHGFIKKGAQKKKGKWPEEHIKRAKEIRTEYEARRDAHKS